MKITPVQALKVILLGMNVLAERGCPLKFTLDDSELEDLRAVDDAELKKIILFVTGELEGVLENYEQEAN